MNRHYAKFNENGERETSITFNIHFSNEEELQPYLKKGFIPVTDEEQALYATNQYLRGTDGKPVQKPPYVPTAEEKMAAIRTERDWLLDASDKYMMIDYPVTDEQRETWRIYRQALRDMPANCDPDNPTWPVAPQ
ncbi:tail fiber assembly protein [Acetonema longum]|uniref:Phage tail assembly chaperone-like domain-containing protein n=1 Tax=Acetonema longum DSM 6540 TaxID=1009370 RepID=F7NE72_9FIRM|nr:tail fiber assembly protein [Acetonema longum]EGO65727.1 hypothetical protein ALO_01674 [Acetonema longum DSM 6540]